MSRWPACMPAKAPGVSSAGGVPPGDILVLAQRGVIGTPIFEALHAHNAPVRSYYAEAELDARSAQEHFAYLKLLVDREDRVTLRWLVGLNSANWLCRDYCRLRGYADAQAISPCQVLCNIADGPSHVAHTGALVKRFSVIRAELDRLTALHTDAGTAGIIDDLFPEGDDGVRDLRALSLGLLENDADMTPEDF